MIKSFRDKRTEAIYREVVPKGLSRELAQSALRKLRLVDAAAGLDDLRSPPGNRLEALRGDRAGQHSVRVNQQWRICFTYRDGSFHQVELVDYH